MNQVTQNPSETMTSVELVAVINEMREEGAAVLQHKNFLAKVEKVLGVETAAKFSAARIDSRGKKQPCYALPQREANLMVMSESYKVQAAVYDRMIKLETASVIAPPQPTAPLRISVHLRDGLRDDEWDVLYETMHDIAGTSELFFNAIYSQFVRKFKHHVPYNEALRYLREVRIDYCSGFTSYYRGGVLVV